MIVRHIFENSHDHSYTLTQNGDEVTLDFAMLCITRVKIAVRNYYPRSGLVLDTILLGKRNFVSQENCKLLVQSCLHSYTSNKY
jgi:hypothetical protein